MFFLHTLTREKQYLVLVNELRILSWISCFYVVLPKYWCTVLPSWDTSIFLSVYALNAFQWSLRLTMRATISSVSSAHISLFSWINFVNPSVLFSGHLFASQAVDLSVDYFYPITLQYCLEKRQFKHKLSMHFCDLEPPSLHLLRSECRLLQYIEMKQDNYLHTIFCSSMKLYDSNS